MPNVPLQFSSKCRQNKGIPAGRAKINPMAIKSVNAFRLLHPLGHFIYSAPTRNAFSLLNCSYAACRRVERFRDNRDLLSAKIWPAFFTAISRARVIPKASNS
jgi:hypothetical protein